MTFSLAPIPPPVFKAILEKEGFKIQRDTEYIWAFFKDDSPAPVIILPKKGKLVALDVMMDILDQIKMNDGKYLALLEEVRRT